MGVEGETSCVGEGEGRTWGGFGSGAMGSCGSKSEGVGETIAVFGAAGSVGSVVVAGLSESGRWNVRAVTHDLDGARAKAHHSREKVTVVEVKRWSEKDVISEVVAGCAAVLVIPPLTESRTADTLTVMRACRDAKVGLVVLISASVVRYPGRGLIHEHFAGIENAASKIGQPYCLVRVPFLLENLRYHAESIRREGVIRAPCSDSATFRPVAADDVAAVCLAILKDRTGHVGAQYDLMGQPINMQLIASMMSEKLGRPIRFESFEPSSGSELFVGARIPAFHATALAQLYALIERSPELFSVPSMDLERVGGQSVTIAQAWISGNETLFR